MPPAKTTTEVDCYIGERIRGMRHQRKVSQEELGRLLGVTFQQVQKYEKGRNRVSGGRLTQLAAVFQCAVADFLPPTQRNGKTKELSNADRVVATKDGNKLIDEFVTIKNERLRAAIVTLATQLARII